MNEVEMHFYRFGFLVGATLMFIIVNSLWIAYLAKKNRLHWVRGK
jgi:hypothetical protein